jgi:hypothetical protein
MPVYLVHMSATANSAIEVEAADEEEAAELAYEQGPSGVCAQCCGWNEVWSLDIGDFEIDEDVVVGNIVYRGVEKVAD